jgi:hypothetical protein
VDEITFKKNEIFSPLDKLLGAVYFGVFTYLLPLLQYVVSLILCFMHTPPSLPPLLSVRTKPMGKEIHHFYYIYPVCDYGRQCCPLLYQVGRFITFRAL